MGAIILINGPSSAGKTTLAKAIQHHAREPWLRWSFDLLLDGDALPMEHIRADRAAWDAMRPSVFHGLHQSLHAFAAAGCFVVCDHIIETTEWLHDLLRCVAHDDIFFIGLHCTLPELQRREIARGNRTSGEAERDYHIVHHLTQYDLELDAEQPVLDNAVRAYRAWQQRQRPAAIDRMLAQLPDTP